MQGTASTRGGFTQGQKAAAVVAAAGLAYYFYSSRQEGGGAGETQQPHRELAQSVPAPALSAAVTQGIKGNLSRFFCFFCAPGKLQPGQERRGRCQQGRRSSWARC